MALPFYNQGDQDIYAGGDHFVPQEQYRLNYTPSQSLASTIGNTGGVTGAQAANPYIWPPQGGGGGNSNIYGYDPTDSKQFDIQTWDRIGTPVHDFDEGEYGWVDKTVTGYKSPSGYKTKKGKNIHNFGIDYVPAWAQAFGAGKKIQGNRVGEIKGTFSDAEDPEDVWNITKQKVKNVPIIKRWRENKEIKKQEKAAADKIVSDRAAQNANKNRSIYDGGYRSVDSSGNAVSFSSPQGTTTFDSKSGRGRRDYDRGGRIGMAKGKIPLPKAKKSGSFPWETSLIGLASLFNRRPLMLGKIKGINPGEYGTRQWRANKMKNLARMGGKWAGRTRFAAPALMNPWLMAPAALGLGAKYAVGKAFDPYRDETGKIGAEGHAQLASAARAREALMAQRNAARENRRDGGLAGIL